jgi:hypothetical protein
LDVVVVVVVGIVIVTMILPTILQEPSTRDQGVLCDIVETVMVAMMMMKATDEVRNNWKWILVTYPLLLWRKWMKMIMKSASTNVVVVVVVLVGSMSRSMDSACLCLANGTAAAVAVVAAAAAVALAKTAAPETVVLDQTYPVSCCLTMVALRRAVFITALCSRWVSR